MASRTNPILLPFALLCASALLPFDPAAAQARAEPSASPAPLKRTLVRREDASLPGYEAVVMRVELAAGAHAGRHSHPGDEISYVTEGEGELLVDGEAPRRLKPGEAFVIKAGKVHDLHNTGSGPVQAVGVYMVEKGKPLATPAR